jgi:hypothetical protein
MDCLLLRTALGQALANHPRAVLEAAGGGYTVADACGGLGMESSGEADSPETQMLAALHRRRSAVAAIRQPSLAAKKRECLRRLRTVERAWRAFE